MECLELLLELLFQGQSDKPERGGPQEEPGKQAGQEKRQSQGAFP